MDYDKAMTLITASCSAQTDVANFIENKTEELQMGDISNDSQDIRDALLALQQEQLRLIRLIMWRETELKK